MYIMVCYVCKRFRFSNVLDAQPRCGHGSINDMVLNYTDTEIFKSDWKILPIHTPFPQNLTPLS